MSSKRIQAMARLIDEIGAKIREYNRTFKHLAPKVKAESGEI